jgi:hypothetical protein
MVGTVEGTRNDDSNVNNKKARVFVVVALAVKIALPGGWAKLRLPFRGVMEFGLFW